jgi:hypothetical protein
MFPGIGTNETDPEVFHCAPEYCIEQLRAEIARLRKALEKYADPMAWFNHEGVDGLYLCWRCQGKEDVPDIAREALAPVSRPAMNAEDVERIREEVAKAARKALEGR